MKALTLHQPWASLIAAGIKTIETRNWAPAGYEGPLAIHAAKTVPRYAYDALASNPELLDAVMGEMRTRLSDLPVGRIVAVCNLATVLPSEREPGVAWGSPVFEKNRPFGDFSPGRWLWLLEDIKPLVFPIRATGHQGLWEWEPPE